MLVALVALAFSAGGALAQQGTITGTVIDASSSRTLPGVNVVVEELGVGAATDAEGQFRITEVPTGSYTLSATYVGYQRKTVSVTVREGETTTARIRLQRSAVELDDVVVTALGIEREERSLGYGVEEVSGADLEQAGETNFLSTLTGKAAGAQISTSSQMGGSANINIRGASSIAGDNQPLIIIDGVPLNNSSFNRTGQASGTGGYDYGNAASMINPSNVKSVSVLKGASATALYGSRASNGVILVETKDGSEREEGIGVSFETGVTVGDIYGYPDYQNEFGGGSSSNFAMVNGELRADYGTDQSWGPPLDGRMVREWFSFDDVNGKQGELTPWDAHPDNVDNFFRNTITANTNLAFSQAGEDFNYRLTLNDKRQQGAMPESNLQRQTFGLNGSINLSERLRASATARFVNEDVRGRPGSGYTNANGPWLQFNHFGQRQIDLSEGAPMRDIERPNGDQRTWNWANSTTAPGAGNIIYANNPFWVQERNFQEDDTQRIFGNINLAYDLTSNLTASVFGRLDYYNQRRQDRVAVGSVGGTRFSGAIAGYEEDVREVQETNVGGELTYNGDLTETISLSGTVGGKYRENSLSRNLGQTAGGLISPGVYTVENSPARPTVTDYFEESALAAVFGKATVGYDEMVYLGVTGRNDWSSTLPADNNAYFYPSVNASFVFTELSALENSEVLSFGKVRASWAQVGRTTDPYQLNFTYPAGTPYNGKPLKSLTNVLPNSELKRELTTETEVGAQLRFFDDRFRLDATLYSRETEDLIQQVSTSRASGFTARSLNAGTISNKGVELGLDITPLVSTESFSWDMRLNWSKNVNEVVSLAEGIENLPVADDNTPPFGPQIVAREGEELGTFYGTGFATNDEGERIVTPNAFATYRATSRNEVLGSYRPDWTGSASTTFSYNNLSLRVLIDGQKGGQIWSLSNLFGLYSGMFQETVEGNQRRLGVMPEGANSAEISPRSMYQGLFGLHEAHLYDASYIKLREATISYRLPQKWLADLPLRQFNVSVAARNLATLLKYTPNFDPTAVTRDAGNLQGIEAGQMPPKRTFGLRLRATF
jgi:TonB-linked SusC/RagA family outer membrane protein